MDLGYLGVLVEILLQGRRGVGGGGSAGGGRGGGGEHPNARGVASGARGKGQVHKQKKRKHLRTFLVKRCPVSSKSSISCTRLVTGDALTVHQHGGPPHH